MNIDNDREIIQNMSDKDLKEAIYQLEFDRMEAAHYGHTGNVQYFHLLLDIVVGEMLKRDKSVRNDKEPKWDTPKCPDTFYQLMSLGAGELS